MLVVVAHPDDETFGTGSVIAHQVARGLGGVVCAATRGGGGGGPDRRGGGGGLAGRPVRRLTGWLRVRTSVRCARRSFVRPQQPWASLGWSCSTSPTRG